MRFLLFIFLILINFVENRRVFVGPTNPTIFPIFPSRPFKINHKFLPKYEYTVFYGRTTTSSTPTTTSTIMPSTTMATTFSTTSFPTTAIFDFKSTTSTSTTTITYKPFTIDIPTTPFISTSNAPSTTTTDDDQIPSSNDSSFDWFGALVVFLIFFAAITFFVIRRKCTSPSGTYKIPKTNLVPRDYYVNFCKIDDEFIEIHAKALYGPSYVTSVENQNFEEHKDDETCL